MTSLIKLALQYRGLVLLIAIIAMGYGSYLATRLPIDVFPDLDKPRVVLLSEAPGLSPDEAETLVAQPIDQAILGAPGVEAVRSQTSAGFVVTYVEFTWSTEIRTARQTVQERLALVNGQLPPGVRPMMTPPSSIMGQIIHVGLVRKVGPNGGSLIPIGKTNLLAERVEKENRFTIQAWQVVDRRDVKSWKSVPIERSEWQGNEPGRSASITVAGQSHLVTFRTPTEDRMDLRTTGDWIIRPRLLSQPGIAEVIVMGGERKQYQVLVDPVKLHEWGVTIADVDRAITENNLNVSGGITEERHVERAIRVIGRLGPEPKQVLDDLRQVVVRSDRDRPILLGQVAEVVEGPAPTRGDAGVDGGDAVVITIVKQNHADTRRVTDDVKRNLREIELSLPADVHFNTELFQLKAFIDRAIYYVGEALAIGAVLVVIILFLFLLNLRTTFITLTAIPLSLVITTLVFRLMSWLTGTDLSINVMTLGGIAVAMGELVDDAIVDVENIDRRLRENAGKILPRPKLEVILKASQEIRSAIVFGTAVVVLSFLPLFALSGLEGRLFVPLGLAYIVSILASLIVSMTVTPVLSYYLLKVPVRSNSIGHHNTSSPLVRLLQWLAGFLIRFSMRRAGLILLATWLLVIYSGWRLTTLGSDFLPKFDEGSVQFDVALPTGASIGSTREAAMIMDAKLRAMQVSPENPDGDILHFVRRSGRAELDEHAEPISRSEYILTMNPAKIGQRAEFLKRVTDEFKAELPGADVEAEQPLDHLISHMLSGIKSNIAVKIVGDDLDQLQRMAKQVKTAIEDIPGLTEPVIEPQEIVDELHIELRARDLAYYGLSRQYVAKFVETAMKGDVITQVVEGSRRFDVIMKFHATDRTDYERIGDLRIDLPSGKGQIRLKDVATIIDAASGPSQINRENVRRRAVVRCNTQGRDLGSLVSDIEKRIKSRVTLPSGYFIEYGGQFAAQRSASVMIAILAGVSIIGVFVVLFLLYPSLRISLQILNAVPTAFIGGVLALVITHQTLTVASLVGFVSLGGIAVRNGILLVTHYFHLMREEGESFSQAMVLRGSLERLSPVLMTALTAGIGLVPLVIGGQKPGLEILYPVSTVILGGLITSTFCEFLIHPGLFWKFSGRDAERLVNQPEA